MKRLVASLALFLACALPASANSLIPGDDTPVSVDPSAVDSFSAAGIGMLSAVASQSELGIGTAYGLYVPTEVCISFENTGTKTLNTIRFGFATVDAFGAIVSHIGADRVGSFAPGVPIMGMTTRDYSGNSDATKNCWTFRAIKGPRILVRVIKAAYEDGTTWPESAPATPVTDLPSQ